MHSQFHQIIDFVLIHQTFNVQVALGPEISRLKEKKRKLFQIFTIFLFINLLLNDLVIIHNARDGTLEYIRMFVVDYFFVAQFHHHFPATFVLRRKSGNSFKIKISHHITG